MSETFEVRDMRHKEKFFVDDAYLNGYAKHLGTTTSMVYFVLCRHADKNQECFPSYESIGEKLGISIATVKRSIKELKEWVIISIGKRKRAGGKFMHNTYTLTDKSTWKSKPEVISEPWSPEVKNDITTGHPRPDKDTHSKDTHTSSETSSQVFDWDTYLQGMIDHKRKDLNIIGFFLKTKGVEFNSKAKAEVAVRRHLKAAKELAPFDKKEIGEKIRKLNYDFPKFTLETVIKELIK